MKPSEVSQSAVSNRSASLLLIASLIASSALANQREDVQKPLLVAMSPGPIVQEVPASFPPIYGNSQYAKRKFKAASDGRDFLVVWRSNGIAGSRITEGGEVLDRIQIAVNDGLSADPAITWGGSYYLVVWHGENADRTIYASTISQDGRVLQRARRILSVDNPFGGFGGGDAVTVAWNGTHFFLVWSFFKAMGGVLLDGELNLVGQQVNFLSSPSSDPRFPSIASDGKVFLVAYKDNFEVQAALVDSSGTVATRTVVYSTNGERTTTPIAGFTGNEYVIVWGTSPGFRGAILNRSGTLRGEAQTLPGVGEPVELLRVGGRLLLSSLSDSFLPPAEQVSRLQELYLSNALQSGTPVTLSRSSALGSNGTRFVVALHGEPRLSRGGSELGFSTGSPDDLPALTGPLERIQVVLSASPQLEPTIETGADVYLLAWLELRTTDSQSGTLVVGRASRKAERLTGPGITIAEGVAESPRIAFNGEHHLLVWMEKDPDGRVRVLATRLDSSSRPIDPIPVVLDESNKSSGYYDTTSGLAVASDGQDWLVAWPGLVSVNRPIMARRIRRTGVVEPAVQVTLKGSHRFPSIAWNGTEYLIAWERRVPTSLPCQVTCIGSYTGDIAAARISASGTLIDSENLDVAVLPGDQSTPAVGSDGDQFLIVWTSHVFSPEPSATEIRSVLVSRNGVLLDAVPADNGAPVAFSARTLASTSVAWTGTQYAISWMEVFYAARFRQRLFHTRLDRRGRRSSVVARVDPDDANHDDWVSSRALVSSGGQTVIAFRRWTADPAYGGVNRVFFRVLDEPGRLRRRGVSR